MSSFGVFQKINRKLDEGWKMTNVECPICKTIILGHPTTKELYCVKCEMPVKFDKEDEELEVEVVGSDPKSSPQEVPQQTVDEDDFDNMVIQRQNEIKRKKQDELSKKMGELLLQGWCMLEECCETCLFPLMRKRGELVCVGCGPVKSQEEILAEQKKVLEEEENKRKAEEMKKEETKLKSPVKVKAVESDSDSSEEEVILSKKEKKNKPQAKKVKEESESSISSDSSSEEEKPKCKKIKQEKKKEFMDKREKKNEKIKDKKKKAVPCDKEKGEDQNCSNKNFNYNCEIGQFQESIDFYTQMTQALSEDFNKLSTIGLISNLDKVKEILKIQKKIDENKLELIRKLNK